MKKYILEDQSKEKFFTLSGYFVRMSETKTGHFGRLIPSPVKIFLEISHGFLTCLLLLPYIVTSLIVFTIEIVLLLGWFYVLIAGSVVWAG